MVVPNVLGAICIIKENLSNVLSVDILLNKVMQKQEQLI